MTTPVNEFSLNLPMTSPATPTAVEFATDTGYDNAIASVMSPAGAGDDTAVVVGDAVDPMLDPSKITVYAGQITPISYNDTDPVNCFDIVFTVGVNCEGSSKTYQVVKRIGIDKCKIAAQAASGAPVSVVEAKVEPTAPIVETKKPEMSEVYRFRRLAGLE